MYVAFVLRHLRRQRRPRADQRHASVDDVEQLRQFVQRPLAQEAPDRGHPGIITHFEQQALGTLVRPAEPLQTRFGVDVHRTELVHPERITTATHPGLLEDRRTPAVQPHRDCEPQEQRRENHDRGERETTVDQRLQDPPATGELRFLDMEQGKASHRADRNTGTGDVGERGAHQNVDVAALESPHHLSKGVAVQLRTDGHRRRSRGLDRGVEAVQRSDDRNPEQVEATSFRQVMAVATRGPIKADPDHRPAGRRVTMGQADEGRRRLTSTDNQHPVQTATVSPHMVKNATPTTPADNRKDGGDGKRNENIASSNLKFCRVGNHRDACGDPGRRVHDPLEFLRTAAEKTSLICTPECHRQRPGHRQ